MSQRVTPTDPSDADVIAASLDNPQAFAAIFERHHRAIFGYLARRMGSTAAEDATSDVFAIAFNRRSVFDLRRGSVRPWLFGIARNVLLNEQRRRAKARSTPFADVVDVAPDPADDVAWAVDAQRYVADGGIADAIAALHPDVRETLYLYALGELTYTEIAETLGVPIGTVRSRLSRARAAIREQAPPFARSMGERGEGAGAP